MCAPISTPAWDLRAAINGYHAEHFGRSLRLASAVAWIVRLRSPDPADRALFVANALAEEADVDTLVRDVELGIRISEAPSLARLVKRRVLPMPGLEMDKEALRDYVRAISKTVFHPSGTAKMGPPENSIAVVSEDLRVRSVDGLRVADA